MIKSLLTFFCVVVISLSSFIAHATNDHLSFETRDVKPRLFELNPYVGDYLGDKFSHSFHAGTQFDVRFTPAFSLGLNFAWTKIEYDSSSNFGRSLENDNLYSSFGVATFNIPAAFLSKENVVETDLFTTLGLGVMRVSNSNRFGAYIGGGMKLFLKKLKWLGFRIEIRNYFSSVPTASGNKFSSDVTFLLGPSFLFHQK